jgi:hypothetical protein
MSKKQYIGLIVLLLLAGASAFYWYEWRPKEIKRACVEAQKESDKKASESIVKLIQEKKITPTQEFIDDNIKQRNEASDKNYKQCLIEKGL